MRSLKNFNVFNKKVLVRCDFNMPISRVIKTIEYLISRKACITLIGHLGDPNGVIEAKLKLDKIAKILQKQINFPIVKAENCMGLDVERYINSMDNGSIFLLENLKFRNQEVDGDIEFAKRFSFLHEIFINDDFADCDKFYASIAGIPQFIPSGAGIVLTEEIENLDKILQGKNKSLVVIVGGMATDEKLNFIDKIINIVDYILVGGLIKEGLAKKEMLFKNQDKIICSTGFIDDFDVDEKTFIAFKEKIRLAKTVFWYGALGKIEEKKYSYGTLNIAKEIIESGSFSVVCGRELADFLVEQTIADKFNFVSNGGNATLKYLAGEKLPGLVALE